MLYAVATLLVIGLIAAVLGFSGFGGTAAGVAKLVFIAAMVLLAASVVFEGKRGTLGRRR
jgi:uncharacterized membrane protein YtjA (UPF0391 family)